MKRAIFILTLALASVGFTYRTREPYRVVFDITSRDSLDQKAVMRWVREVSTASPDADIEIVMYAKGFELAMPDKSPVIEDVKAAMKNPHVSFKVCAIALRNNAVDVKQLLPGVQPVPDGIREIVERQQDHWGYIKVMH